jgi:hypothetical protein
MPNQYNKVELTIETKLPQENLFLKKQYTKALFELLKNKIPQNALFIDELIMIIKQELD